VTRTGTASSPRREVTSQHLRFPVTFHSGPCMVGPVNVLTHGGYRSNQVLGEGIEAAHPSRGVGHRRLAVLGVVGRALFLVSVDDLLHLRRQGLLQPPGLLRERRAAGARAREDEAHPPARVAAPYSRAR